MCLSLVFSFQTRPIRFLTSVCIEHVRRPYCCVFDNIVGFSISLLSRRRSPPRLKSRDANGVFVPPARTKRALVYCFCSFVSPLVYPSLRRSPWQSVLRDDLTPDVRCARQITAVLLPTSFDRRNDDDKSTAIGGPRGTRELDEKRARRRDDPIRRRFIDSSDRRRRRHPVVYFIRIFFFLLFSLYEARPINFESIIIIRRTRSTRNTPWVWRRRRFFYIWPKRVSPSGRNDDRSHLRPPRRIYVVSFFFSFTTTDIFIFSFPLCSSVAAGNSSSSSSSPIDIN